MTFQQIQVLLTNTMAEEKTVRFHKSVEVKEIPHVLTMKATDKYMVWYNQCSFVPNTIGDSNQCSCTSLIKEPKCDDL